jgi:hypothetical protein
MSNPYIVNKTIVWKKKNGQNSDILQFMQYILPLSIKQAEYFCNHFSTGDLEESCRMLHAWLRKNVRYDEDGYTQEPKLPGVVWRDRPTADCKTYALFAYSVLHCLGYDPKLKFISQTEEAAISNQFDHVYCVCEGIVIDPCMRFFNEEPRYLTSKHISMKIQAIAGTTTVESEPLNYNDIGYQFPQQPRIEYYAGVGGLKDVWNKVKDTAKGVITKGKEVAKDVAFALPRNSFLLLTELNVFELASKGSKLINKGKKKKLEDMWQKWGGDPKKLISAIGHGAKRKPIFPGGKKGVGQTGAEIAAAITAATPIIIAMVSLFKSEGLSDTDKAKIESFSKTMTLAAETFTSKEGIDPIKFATDVLTTAAPILTPGSTSKENPDNQLPTLTSPTPTPTPTTEKKDNTMLLVGAGLAIFFMFNK